MRKSLICLAALLIGAASLTAQNNGQNTQTQPQDTTKKVKTEVPEATAQKAVKETTKKVADENRKKMFVTVQGGGLLSINENFRAYGDDGKNSDLLTLQGSASFGYQFTPVSGVRVWAGYVTKKRPQATVSILTSSTVSTLLLTMSWISAVSATMIGQSFPSSTPVSEWAVPPVLRRLLTTPPPETVSILGRKSQPKTLS